MSEVVHLPLSEHWQESQGDSESEPGEHQGSEHRSGRGDWKRLRRALVADMLIRRVPYRAMAHQLGCSSSTIAKDVKALRAEWATRRAESFDRHVDEQLAVLDRTRSIALGFALDAQGPAPTRLAAIDRVLALEHRRAELLGLNARPNVQTQEEIETMKARASELLAAADAIRERRAGRDLEGTP